ncbi:hypothetical protein TWF694_003627 [Orbilia ellipsospora]|uniref:Uncharacterized protein n=1 Tax=Orbilia ellipsospora TaxID=2528407 RepID=A0AAV9WYS8_9PEZI
MEAKRRQADEVIVDRRPGSRGPQKNWRAGHVKLWGNAWDSLREAVLRREGIKHDDDEDDEEASARPFTNPSPTPSNSLSLVLSLSDTRESIQLKDLAPSVSLKALRA